MKIISQETLQRIQELLEAGTSYDKIVQEVHCSKSTILKVKQGTIREYTSKKLVTLKPIWEKLITENTDLKLKIKELEEQLQNEISEHIKTRQLLNKAMSELYPN